MPRARSSPMIRPLRPPSDQTADRRRAALRATRTAGPSSARSGSLVHAGETREVPVRVPVHSSLVMRKLREMSAIDHLDLRAISRYAESLSRAPAPASPSCKLAIVSCMDSRLDLFGAFGLARSATRTCCATRAACSPTTCCGRWRSVSATLGTREIAIVHHTNCGMDGFDDDGVPLGTGRARPAQRPAVGRAPASTTCTMQARRSLDHVRGPARGCRTGMRCAPSSSTSTSAC